MDDDQLNRMLDVATGEAMYASSSQAALWGMLIRKGLFSKEEAHEAIDLAMLVIEKARHNRPGGGPGAIDHALVRLELLMRQL